MFLNTDRQRLRQNSPTTTFHFLRDCVVESVDVDKGTVGVVDRVGMILRNEINSVPVLFTSFGDGHGTYSLPEINDRGILLFFGPGKAGCLGFIPYNYKSQVNGSYSATVNGVTKSFIKMRKILKGETCLRTKAGSELYFNNKSTIQFTIYNPSDLAIPYYIQTFGPVIDSSTGSETLSTIGSTSFVHRYLNVTNSNEFNLDKLGNFEYNGPKSGGIPTITFTLNKEGVVKCKVPGATSDSDANAVIDLAKTGSLTLTHKDNITVNVSGSGKKITLQFTSGAKVEIEKEKITLNDGTNTIVMDKSGPTVTTTVGSITLEVNNATIKAGGSTKLLTVTDYSTLQSWLASHTHGTGVGPSTPPVVPPPTTLTGTTKLLGA